MPSDGFVTAPTSEFGDVVLATVADPDDEAPAERVLDRLADPTIYAYVLDARQAAEMTAD